MSVPRPLLEGMIFGEQRGRRFTQDSPILPDVWLAYGERPGERHDLLITPHNDVSAGHVARVLRERLAQERASRPESADPPAVAYVQGNVVAEVGFEELVRVLLPMTPWWQRYVWRGTGEYLRRLETEGEVSLADAIRAFQEGEKGLALSEDLLWMIRIIGIVSRAHRGGLDEGGGEEGAAADPREIAAEVVRLTQGLEPPGPDEERLIWRVHRNRPAELAVHRSSLAVKADAARRLFEISCREISWAVVDSGIDAGHPAFRRRDGEGNPYPQPFAPQGDKWRNFTRVTATYDFTRVRALLNPGTLDEAVLPQPLRDRLSVDGPKGDALREELVMLRRHLLTGREVDWKLLRTFLQVPHDGDYQAPKDGHGTHVAGILAADWDDPEEGEPMAGLCPDLELFDFRVLDDRGRGDEFSVIAALQFLRHLNASRDHLVVHGANLSLSIRHDVANYACGRTPVCDECSRVVGAGIVVVAAAGNEGYLQYQTAGGLREGYHTVSITDPGNAEDVITVGATHRYRPHDYGVSYFSSRGPTGDGRIKPDLVAPGEKVVGPLPDGGRGRRDGTSMAAPHVSGAAALLIARHRELAGSPRRIKEVLCATATDLGRERYFQGCGMVDVLRAVQHV